MLFFPKIETLSWSFIKEAAPDQDFQTSVAYFKQEELICTVYVMQLHALNQVKFYFDNEPILMSVVRKFVPTV